MSKYNIKINYDKNPPLAYENLSREAMLEKVKKIFFMNFDEVKNVVVSEVESSTVVEIITESSGKIVEYRIGDIVRPMRSTSGINYIIKSLDGEENCAAVGNVEEVGKKGALTKTFGLSWLYKVNKEELK